MADLIAVWGAVLLAVGGVIVTLTPPNARWRTFIIVAFMIGGALTAYNTQIVSGRLWTAGTGGDNFPIFTTMWNRNGRLAIWNRKYTPLFDIHYQC